MNIAKKYIKRETYDYEKLCNSAGGMRNAIKIAGKQNWIPEEYTEEDFNKYVESLWSGREDNGSWCPAPNSEKLPPDEVIEFCIFPTILALGAISLRWGMLSEDQKSLASNSMDWLAERFKGYGEDSIFQLAEMIFMMSESNFIEFIRKENLGSKLQDELDKLSKEWNEKLDNGDTVLPYGGDYKDTYLKLTVLLSDM